MLFDDGFAGLLPRLVLPQFPEHYRQVPGGQFKLDVISVTTNEIVSVPELQLFNR
jgi:hypothetical protein